MEKLFEILQLDKDQLQKHCQSIIENPTLDFEKLNKNKDKIRYCYQRLKSNSMVNDKQMVGKNEIRAIEARNEGNILFIKDKKFVRALEQYNKSICLSPLDSENLGICYANRSALYFQSGLYKLCMDNIQLALQHKYPKSLVPKLIERQKKCFEKLNKDSYEKYINEKAPIKLAYPSHKRMPFIIEDLEFGKSKEFGRYIRAKRDLYPGDFVIIEKPYIKCLNEGSEYNKCSYCMQSAFLNLFPCQYCTKIMFCGATCAEMSWKRYHKYECRVVETDINRSSIRATLIGFTLFDNCSKLRELIESVKKKPVTGFDFNYKEISEEEIFKACYCLATNSSQRSTVDIFQRSNLLAQSWHTMITQSNNLRELLKTTEDEDLFLDTLLHFSQLGATNNHELRNMAQNPDDQIDEYGFYSPRKFGTALFPIISLLNHSCAPNVSRLNSNGQIAIMVIRPIKAGDQLYDNYVGGFVNHTREERRAKLSLYHFECKCEACLSDYPLIRGLKLKALKSFKEIESGLDKVLDYDKEWAVKYYSKSKKFVRDFGHHYPCYEVCAAQHILEICRQILFENTPLELQLRPFIDDNKKEK